MTSSSSIQAARSVFLRACSALTPDDWDGYTTTLQALDPMAWRAVDTLATRHGLLGLAARGFELAYQRTGFRAPNLDQLRASRQAQLMQLMVYRKAARRVADALSARRICFVVYKGAVLAEEIYGDLSLRAFRDCDILVHPEQLEETYGILQELGYSVPDEQTFKNLIDRSQQAVAMRHPDGSVVDLHWWIAGDELLSDEPDLIWQFCRPQHEPGRLPGWRMSPELTLILLATHFCAHQFREIKPLVDFYMTAAKLHDRIDIDELFKAAKELSLRQTVDLAACLCNRMFAPNPLIQQLNARAPRFRMRIADAMLTDRIVLDRDSTFTVGNRLRRVVFGGTFSSSSKAFRRMLIPKARELELRFKRPFDTIMYAQYYFVQLHRLVLRSKKPFDIYIRAHRTKLEDKSKK